MRIQFATFAVLLTVAGNAFGEDTLQEQRAKLAKSIEQAKQRITALNKSAGVAYEAGINGEGLKRTSTGTVVNTYGNHFTDQRNKAKTVGLVKKVAEERKRLRALERRLAELDAKIKAAK